MILSDRDIKHYIDVGFLKINPLYPDTIRENGIDIRIGDTIGRFKAINKPFDPHTDNPKEYIYLEEGESFIIYPHERILVHSIEYIKMPRDLMAFINLRSSYARIGLTIPPTIVDASFEGQLTVELIGGNFPIRFHRGDRFLHLIFARLTSPVASPYSGKYQGQKGIKIPVFKPSNNV